MRDALEVDGGKDVPIVFELEEDRRDNADRRAFAPIGASINRILKPDGTALSLSSKSLIRLASNRFLYRWDTEGLDPGRYRFELNVTESFQGHEALKPFPVVLRKVGGVTP